MTVSSVEQLKKMRDEKVRAHLEQFAPVWLVDEKIIQQDEAIQFNVVFQHPQYGWVNRRYRFDGFNQVLYFKGQHSITEQEALKVQETEPYLSTLVSDIPNAYGG
jgi:hypothetical protein